MLLLLQRHVTMSTLTTPAGDFRTAAEQEQARPGLLAEAPGALAAAALCTAAVAVCGTAAVAACHSAATVLQCSWNRYLQYCCKRYLRYRRRLLSMSAFVTRCLRAHAMNRCSSSLCNGASGSKGSKWATGRGREAVQGCDARNCLPAQHHAHQLHYQLKPSAALPPAALSNSCGHRWPAPCPHTFHTQPPPPSAATSWT